MDKRLTIVAGAGALVPEIVLGALADGWQVQLVTLANRETIDGTVSIPGSLSDPVSIIAAIRAFPSTHLCLAGGVNMTNDARSRLLTAVSAAAPGAGAMGDTAVSSFAAALEFVSGAKIVGAHQIVPSIVVADGSVAGPPLAPDMEAAALFALQTARDAGKLDLGQAVVATGNRVLAVEDISGTDMLIERAGSFRHADLVAPDTPLVLAKAAKPDQSLLIDMPAIGPKTIEKAAHSRISVIALQAGQTMILQRAETCANAERLGITIIGRTLSDG